MQIIDRTARNVLANLIGAAGLAILSLVLNYLYYRFLGDEAFGLVVWYATLASVLSPLDFGMSRTAFRELARRSATEALPFTSRSVLMTLQLVQWSVFLILGALIVTTAPLLADWLNPRSLSHETLVSAIALSGLCISVSQPRGVYQSGLNGIGRQVTSVSLQGFFTAVRGLATLLVLRFADSQILTFFVVQLVGLAIETVVTGMVLWHALPAGSVAPRLSILEDVKHFAGADGASSIISMMMTVSDKVVLSRFVPLGQFGQYGLITLVCQVLPKVTYPFINAYFHEFIVAWQRRDYRRLSGQYQHVSEIINPILIAAGLVLVLFALDIVTLLTGSRIVAGRLELPMQLYALGTLFFTLQFVPHILQLASGWASLSLVISGTAILGYIPAVYLLTPLWGLVAPPAVWLATNLMTFPLFIYMTHKRLLPELKSLWIKKTLLQPAVICALALLGAREVLYPTDTLIGLFGEMTVVALFAAAALFLASYPIRTWTILIAATMMKFARAQK